MGRSHLTHILPASHPCLGPWHHCALTVGSLPAFVGVWASPWPLCCGGALFPCIAASSPSL